MITPNLFEANCLLDRTIQTTQQMQQAAHDLGKFYQINVLIKGGHLKDSESKDVLYLYQENVLHWFTAPRIATHNTHGTGCSLSAAIASYLAQEFSLIESVDKAKKYLTNAIHSGSQLNIGTGNGPVDHFYFLRNPAHDLSKNV